MATCMKLPPTLYAVGANITWTQLSSASKKEQVAVKLMSDANNQLLTKTDHRVTGKYLAAVARASSTQYTVLPCWNSAAISAYKAAIDGNYTSDESDVDVSELGEAMGGRRGGGMSCGSTFQMAAGSNRHHNLLLLRHSSPSDLTLCMPCRAGNDEAFK